MRTSTQSVLDQLTTWRAQCAGLAPDSISVPDVCAMTQAVYAALAMAAVYGARRGRAIAEGIPTPDVSEDIDTATDAIGEVWALCAAGKVARPMGAVYWRAFKLAQRRAIHRIRTRGSLLVEPACDKTLPPWESTMDNGDATGQVPTTFDALLARCAPHNRERLNQAAARWRDPSKRNGNEVRDMRRAVGMAK